MAATDGKDTTHTNPEGVRRVADCFVREATKLGMVPNATANRQFFSNRR